MACAVTARTWTIRSAGMLLIGICAIVIPAATPAQTLPVPTLSVSPTPFVRIGSEAPGGQFVGPYSTLLPSGAIVTLDPRSRELRVYTKDGREGRLIGKPGDGPGEISSGSTRLARAGDTLLIIQVPPGPSQVHKFVESGFVRRDALRSPQGGIGLGGGVSGLASVGGGRYLTVLSAFRPFTPVPMTVTRDTLSLALVATSESSKFVSLFVSLGDFPMSSRVAYEIPEPRSVRVAEYPLGPSLAYAGGDGVVFVGDAASGKITLFDTDGAVIRSFAFPLPRRRFDGAALRNARAAAMSAATNTEERSRIAAIFNVKRETLTPAFRRFVGWNDSLLWVELFREDEEAPATLVALDVHGKAVARLTLPVPMRVDEVGKDYVIGVATVDDEPEVRAYRYRRSR